ncbi:hypothetical protein DVS28_b0250 (plasmid) [Euzebya pacifica]|uniref:Uncharacterized protein n=1 Tax=Euzebya pacifica TaxID=1608957 RepID=A0A346Y6C3_9ACTN|nr:hypothetical protein [Euzebya pacifica]AXV10020.1 hypothetical protein DVS28_b0250 [Euzebya pacifica]
MTVASDIADRLSNSHETFWGTRSFVTVAIPNLLYPTPPPPGDRITALLNDGWEDNGAGFQRPVPDRPDRTEHILIVPYVNHPPEPSRTIVAPDPSDTVRLDAPEPALVDEVVARADWVNTHVHLSPTSGNRAIGAPESTAILDGLPDWFDAYADAVFWAKTQYADFTADAVEVTFSVKQQHRDDLAKAVTRLLDTDDRITLVDRPATTP